MPRKSPRGLVGYAPATDASMRPRLYAAEIGRPPTMNAFNWRLASMRPRLYAAEIAAAGRERERAVPGFNEAAALCRGNLAEFVDSPRPRNGFNEAAALCRGNLPSERRGRPGPDASMRPRLYAAEIGASTAGARRRGRASMRPRLYAAEILPLQLRRSEGRGRFNEAAALCRGNPRAGVAALAEGLASMRPRLYAAEIGDYIENNVIPKQVLQ